ncbi:MAG TPA: hypothetical protein VFV98_15065 [Vicinamibacterales bacterium]|nr:hypothetical protein [Vicinamibacterales bacterium]
MTMNTMSLAVIAGLVLGSAPMVAAQSKRPDFSGVWRQDTAASKALTEKKGEVWRVAGAGTGGAAASGAGATPPPGAIVMTPVTTITQSDKEIVIERSYEKEVINHDVYKLDGSVSINATRNSTSRSTTVWKGASLVTTGTFQMDLSDSNAVDSTGKPLAAITRTFVTTRTLMPDGTMQIENRSTQNGQERVSWSVMVRVKPS